MKLIKQLREEFEMLVKAKMKEDDEPRKEVLEGLWEEIFFNGCDNKEDMIFKGFIEEELDLNIVNSLNI